MNPGMGLGLCFLQICLQGGQVLSHVTWENSAQPLAWWSQTSLPGSPPRLPACPGRVHAQSERETTRPGTLVATLSLELSFQF